MSHQGSKKFFVADDADRYPSGEAAANLLAVTSTGPPTTIQTPSGSFAKLPSVSSLLKLANVALDEEELDLPPPGAQSRTSLIRSMGQGGSSQSASTADLRSRASQADLTYARGDAPDATSVATTKRHSIPQSTPTTSAYAHPPPAPQTAAHRPHPHITRVIPTAQREAPHLRLASRLDPSSGPTLSTLQYVRPALGNAPLAPERTEARPMRSTPSPAALLADLAEFFASRNHLEVENTAQRARISELESQLYRQQAELREVKENYEVVRHMVGPKTDSFATTIRGKNEKINQLRDENAYLIRQRNEALDFARSQPSGANFTPSAKGSTADKKRRKLGSGAGFSVGEFGINAGQPSGTQEQGPRGGQQAVRGWGV